MILTNDNYYSLEANKDYMSVSQFKELIGTSAKSACEYTGVSKLNGDIEFELEPTTSLLVGSYVDAYFEGTLDIFRSEHPELYKKTGDKGLKADFVQAENIINRIENDKLFKEYMSGEKQRIMTNNLFGIDWKIKMDSYFPGDKIVDLKVMRDMNAIYSEKLHRKTDFIHYWGYDIQGAVYQKIVELTTGKKLPFFIACATKESPSNIEIIEITQPHLDNALHFVEENIDKALALKNGSAPAKRCNNCVYCRLTKMLVSPITIDDILLPE